MKSIIWRIQVWGFRLTTLLVSLMSLRTSMRFGEVVGILMYNLLPARRKIAIENISNCIDHMKSQPEWGGGAITAPDLTRAVFLNLGRSLVETALLYRGSGAKIIDAIELRGVDHYKQAVAQGRGMILLTGHCGNWELMALGFGQRFKNPISVLARRQDNPFLNRMVEDMRSHYNNKVIYKSGALKGIISAVRRSETIGILVDQSVMPKEGCLINFMGRKAWASKLPVILAQKTGVPVVPVFIYRENDHHVMQFYPEVNFEGDKSDAGVIRDVQTYTSILERFVVEHPDNWYWIHRRWKRAGETI